MQTPVASWRHTAILVAIFLALAVGGTRAGAGLAGTPGRSASHMRLYASLLLAEWGLAYYVWRGLGSRGLGFHALVGGHWTRAADIARDLALGLAVWAVWEGISHLLPAVDGRAVRTMLPTGPAETALWIALSASAGFVEEVVFRGYFQRQFAALTGSAGVCGQASSRTRGRTSPPGSCTADACDDVIHPEPSPATAFAALYRRHAPEVFRLALALCGEPSDAEDITSETFVRAWTSATPIRTDTVRAYLFTIARNVYRERWRKRSREAPLDRAALLLHVRDGLPYREIVQALGLSLPTVKIRIRRARRALAGVPRGATAVDTQLSEEP